MAQNEQQYNTRDLLRYVGAAQKRPQNKLTVRLKLLILTAQAYQKQDKTTGYRYTGFSEASEGIIDFTCSRVLEKAKVAEVELVLSGFTAYEPLRLKA